MSPSVEVGYHADALFQAQCVRWFPSCPPGPPDHNGISTAHKIVAVGRWSDDHEEHLLSLVDIQVTTNSIDQSMSSTTDVLLNRRHDGAVTDIKVADMSSSGEVLMAVSSSRGSICLARLLVPRLPGTSPADIQILDQPCDDSQCLVPWAQPHKGVISSIDVHLETKLVLTAGMDGSLWVLDPCASDVSSTPAFKAASPKGYTSFANARWADSQLIVSATSVGLLELRDTRQGGRPSLRAPPSWGPAGPSRQDPGLPPASQLQPHWLDVHPSRPNLCAVGCSGGVVAVWDLRMQSEPLAATVSDGQVWEVRFDVSEPSSQQQQAVPAVLFSTDQGCLGRVLPSGRSSSGAGSGAEEPFSALLQHHASVNSFDVGGTNGQDIVCALDSHEIVFIRRASAL